MAEEISAEDGALQKGIEAVGVAHQTILKNSQDVNNAVLGSKSWEGPAATDFRNLMVRWDEKADNLLTVLARLNDSLGGTKQLQAENEETSQSTISGLGSAMSGI